MHLTAAAFVTCQQAAHYNRVAHQSSSDADEFELRHASIMEQWEAKRLVDQEAADNWRLEELTKHHESSGWALDAISD